MYLFSALLAADSGYPRSSRAPAGAMNSRVASCSSSKKSAMLENRLKAAESDIQHDLDLSQDLVKPEDTAGVPKGWGQKG